MNHCPVYTRIGGHSYNTTYPGPIGKILTPQIKGLQKSGYLADASSLCGACVEVCPVKIPITEILLRLRNQKEKYKSNFPITNLEAWKARSSNLIWKAWGMVFSNQRMYRLKSLGIAKIGNYFPRWMPILRAWTSVRSTLFFAKKNFISFPLLLDHISIDNPFSAGSYKPASLILFEPNELLTTILLF